MNEQKNNYDALEQYDYIDGEYLEKVVDKYCPLIGLFLINFSILEHELNLAIADFISDRAHETGFVIIEKITTSNKIELFYKMYVRLESFKEKKNKDILNKIKGKLHYRINAFCRIFRLLFDLIIRYNAPTIRFATGTYEVFVRHIEEQTGVRQVKRQGVSIGYWRITCLLADKGTNVKAFYGPSEIHCR